MRTAEFIMCLRNVRGLSGRTFKEVLDLFLEYDSKTAEKREKDAKRKRNVRGKSVDVSVDNSVKERSPIPPKETLPILSSSKPLLDIEDSGCAREREFFDAYNVCAREIGWTVARVLNKSRRSQIRQRIADAGGLDQAFDCLNNFANSKHANDFGSGHNDSEWVIDIDYVIRASKWVQIMEGKFDGIRAQGQTINGHSHAY